MGCCKQKNYFYGYVVLVAVWFTYFTNMGVMYYSMPAMNAKMLEAMGGVFDSASIGLATGLSIFMQGLGSFFVGPYIARKGCKTPLMLGTALLVVFGAALAFLPLNRLTFLLIFGIGIGLSLGCAGIITTQTAINDWFDRKKPMAMAVVLTAGAIGGFVGPFGTRYFIVKGGWTWGWLFVAAVCLIALLVTVVFVISKPADIGQFPDGVEPVGEEKQTSAVFLPFTEIMRDPTIYYYLVNSGTRNLLFAAITGHIVIYLSGCGMNFNDAVLTLSVASIFSLAGRLLCGALPEDKISLRYTLAAANVLMSAALLLMVFFTTLHAVYIGAAFLGIGLGFGHVGSPVLLSRIYGQGNFAVIVGGIAPMSSLISAIGPAVVGMSAAAVGYRLPYVIASVLTLMGGACALAMKENYFVRRPKRAKKKTCSEA